MGIKLKNKFYWILRSLNPGNLYRNLDISKRVLIIDLIRLVKGDYQNVTVNGIFKHYFL